MGLRPTAECVRELRATEETLWTICSRNPRGDAAVPICFRLADNFLTEGAKQLQLLLSEKKDD